MPRLTITEHGERVRLTLVGLTSGEGASLQEAADDLIRRVLELAQAFRSGGFRASGEIALDLEAVNVLCELGEIAAAGEDIRARLFA